MIGETALGTNAAPRRDPNHGLDGVARRNVILGSALFTLLTAGIFWYQLDRITAGDVAPRWADLRWGYLTLILLCLPIETLASGLRIWLLCRVLEPGVSLWTCLKAEWANVAISLLTPSQSGGGPGQIYMLNRGGASLGTALTISLLSFVGTMVGLAGLGVYSLFAFRSVSTGPLFAAATWTLVAITAAMAGAALWPDALRAGLASGSRAVWRLRGGRSALLDWWPPAAARTAPPVDRMDRWTARLVDLVYTYRAELTRFLRAGKASFVAVCLLSLVFLFSRCLLPYLCVRFLGIESGSFGRIVETQMALVFLVFFAPTPGGAGIAEGASLSIMAEIVPVGFAPYYNLLWRFSTAYLAAIAGLLCLGQALVMDARQRRRT
jgi:glycosyltransferase 2 family protein